MRNYRIKPKSAVVPHCDGRYIADVIGTIYDNLEGKYIQPIGEVDKLPIFSLESHVLTEPVTLAFVIALTFKPLYIPTKHLKRMQVEHVNGSFINVDPKDLVWVFPEEGIESSAWAGYYYIPCFTNYLVNHADQVRSARTGELMATAVNSVGYVDLRLTRDDGYGTMCQMHRIKAWTFVSPPVMSDQMHVNHLDLDKLNNAVDNLEWVWPTENNQHARLLGAFGGPKSMKVLDIHTGEILRFSSMTAVAKHYGVLTSAVWAAVNSGVEQRVFRGRYLVAPEDREFPKNPKEVLNRKNGEPKVVLVKNHNTGEVIKYDSVVLMMEDYPELTRKQVCGNLKSDTQKRYGNISFKYEISARDWIS